MPPTHSTDDLIQETLVEVATRLAKFDTRSRDQFWCWIDKIAEGQQVDVLRRSGAGKRGRGRTRSLEQVEHLPDPVAHGAAALGRAELEAQFRTALECLGQRDADVLRLSILEGLSFAEVARRMGYSRPETVRVLFLRARRKLNLSIS